MAEDHSRKGRWKKANKEKNNAHAVVYRAIKSGKIQRKPCEIKGCNEQHTQAHHKDYKNPLDIIFLCTKHHNQVHLGIIKL